MQVSRFTLSEIVDTSILQEIQDKFAEATGLAAVIVDPEGRPITKPSHFACFCNYIRSCDEGFRRCMNCDDKSGRRATQDKRPVVYLCHSGLTDLAAPIIVQDEYIGAFLAGQVVLETEHSNIQEVKEEMYRRVSDLPIDKEKIGELFDQVEIVPEHRIKAGADLIYIMSNYIVEIGLANIVQKQLMLEMKAKAELESLLQVTELKALQSQVNPHFLFNTLNTIARLALLEGAEKTQEVVYALADLLRNNLRDIDVLRTIEEEVKSIRDYLTIQKVRFGDRIASDIQIDAALLEGLIPALTLQPLVENAIIHGLENRVEGGNIFLEGQMDNGDVVLTVRDTGVGMPAERLQSLFREERRQNSHGQTTGLGIINVHKRICHFFGEQYGLSVESVPGEGTSVRLRLPFRHN